MAQVKSPFWKERNHNLCWGKSTENKHGCYTNKNVVHIWLHVNISFFFIYCSLPLTFAIANTYITIRQYW